MAADRTATTAKYHLFLDVAKTYYASNEFSPSENNLQKFFIQIIGIESKNKLVPNPHYFLNSRESNHQPSRKK